MPPTFNVVVAMCTLGDALRDRSPEGTLICEGAIFRQQGCLCGVLLGKGKRWALVILYRVAIHWKE